MNPCDCEFSIDPQAEVCLSNWGLNAEDLASSLGDSLYSPDKTRVRIGDISATVMNGHILSVTKAIRPPPSIRSKEATPLPPLSMHAKARMLERGITTTDIQKALETPRMKGGVHEHNGVTVAMGTSRGGEKVATAWRSARSARSARGAGGFFVE